MPVQSVYVICPMGEPIGIVTWCWEQEATGNPLLSQSPNISTSNILRSISQELIHCFSDQTLFIGTNIPIVKPLQSIAGILKGTSKGDLDRTLIHWQRRRFQKLVS